MDYTLYFSWRWQWLGVLEDLLLYFSFAVYRAREAHGFAPEHIKGIDFAFFKDVHFIRMKKFLEILYLLFFIASDPSSQLFEKKRNK